MRNWRAKTAALVAVSALALTACGGSDDNGDNGGDGTTNEGGSSLSGTVTGAGASFPATVFQDWIAAYQATSRVSPSTTRASVPAPAWSSSSASPSTSAPPRST